MAVPGDNVPLKVWNETIMKQMTECNDRFFTGFIELKENLYVSSINHDAWVATLSQSSFFIFNPNP